MTALALRQATAADADGLVALEEVGFAAGRWSRDLWVAEVDAEDRWVGLVQSDGRIVAAATVQVCGDVADLHRIVVHPSQRRRGLAARLVGDGLAHARGRGAERMLLEVSERNDGAIALYRGLGFREIARRKDYYGRGEDALVMEVQCG